MTDLSITIHLDENKHVYWPGETLSGEYMLKSVDRSRIKVIEVSLLWYTEGKGDEDLEVHHFQRLSSDEGERIDAHQPGRFSVTLPFSPLSYEGAIVKIRWCVRVRVFLKQGADVVAEVPFQLGDVVAAKTS